MKNTLDLAFSGTRALNTNQWQQEGKEGQLAKVMAQLLEVSTTKDAQMFSFNESATEWDGSGKVQIIELGHHIGYAILIFGFVTIIFLTIAEDD